MLVTNQEQITVCALPAPSENHCQGQS